MSIMTVTFDFFDWPFALTSHRSHFVRIRLFLSPSRRKAICPHDIGQSNQARVMTMKLLLLSLTILAIPVSGDHLRGSSGTRKLALRRFGKRRGAVGHGRGRSQFRTIPKSDPPAKPAIKDETSKPVNPTEAAEEEKRPAEPASSVDGFLVDDAPQSGEATLSHSTEVDTELGADSDGEDSESEADAKEGESQSESFEGETAEVQSSKDSVP
jgi:hypothetical protein